MSILDKLARSFRRSPRKRRNTALLALPLAALSLGYALSITPEETAVDAWAGKAMGQAELVSYSQMVEALGQAEKGDRIALYESAVVFEDATRPGDEAPVVTRAGLNYASSSSLAALLAGTEAEVVFPVQPERVPVLLLIQLAFMGMLVFFLMRTMGGGRSGRGAHEMVRTKDLPHGMDDIAGVDAARDDIREVIDLMKDHDRIAANGGRLPKGILLSGAPGTGKTMLARAMAREAGLNFMAIDSAGLHQMFIGVGPSRVRKAFAQARANAPCIVFIDELDSVGSRSGSGREGTDSERSNLINTFLTEMDGLSGSEGVFVIGATNHPERIDPALVRPGRIDRRITIGLPDRKGRFEILKVHTRKMALAEDVDLDSLAGSLPGFSGADLALLANEAAISQTRDGTPSVTAAHFRQARERMILGQRGSVIALGDEERLITARHEAGHAIVAAALPGTDPIEQVSILPRGNSLGHVMQVPLRDRQMETRRRMLDRMAILAGGRAAELKAFREDGATTGAAADIQMLTDIATRMVTEWGMGEAGFLRIEPGSVLARGEAAAAEIRRLADDALARATALLDEHEKAFDILTERLLSEDALPGSEVYAILAASAGAEPKVAA